MAKARAVEAHHAIAAGKKIDQTADCEVLDHGSVAMEQHDARRRRITPIDIVETAPSHSRNLPIGGFLHSASLEKPTLPMTEKYYEQGGGEQYGFNGGHLLSFDDRGLKQQTRSAEQTSQSIK